jgi:hypothetical protein
MGWISYFGVRMNRSATTWLFRIPTTSRPQVVGSTIVLPLYPTKIWLGDSFVLLATFKDNTLWPQIHNDSSNVMLHKLFLPFILIHECLLTLGRNLVPFFLSLSWTHGSSLQPSTYKPLNVTVQTQAKHCFVKSNERGEPIASSQVDRWSLRTSPLEFISWKTSWGSAHRSRGIYGIYLKLMKETWEIIITTCNRLDSETHVDFYRWCFKEFLSIIFNLDVKMNVDDFHPLLYAKSMKFPLSWSPVHDSVMLSRTSHVRVSICKV